MALSHSKMACGYGKDSTLNAELLNPRAQLVQCCACSLLRWGLRMYLSVLLCTHVSDEAPLLQRLEHACKLGVQLGVGCLCCALNCCVVCTLVFCPCQPTKACCFFNHAAALSLWLLLILWAAMACFLHWNVAGQMLQQAWYRFLSSTPPSLSQSLRWGCPSGAGCSSHSAWNLFVGPYGPICTFHHFSPWQLWPFLVGGICSFQHD